MVFVYEERVLMDSRCISFLGEGSSKCEIANSDVNPLKLLDRKPEELILNHTYTDLLPIYAGEKTEFPEKMNVSSNAVLNRLKRSDKITPEAYKSDGKITPETYKTKDGKTYEVVKMVSGTKYSRLVFHYG